MPEHDGDFETMFNSLPLREEVKEKEHLDNLIKKYTHLKIRGPRQLNLNLAYDIKISDSSSSLSVTTNASIIMLLGEQRKKYINNNPEVKEGLKKALEQLNNKVVHVKIQNVVVGRNGRKTKKVIVAHKLRITVEMVYPSYKEDLDFVKVFKEIKIKVDNFIPTQPAQKTKKKS